MRDLVASTLVRRRRLASPFTFLRVSDHIQAMLWCPIPHRSPLLHRKRRSPPHHNRRRSAALSTASVHVGATQTSTSHTPLVQSLFAKQPLWFAQDAHWAAPQSTSVSAPFGTLGSDFYPGQMPRSKAPLDMPGGLWAEAVGFGLARTGSETRVPDASLGPTMSKPQARAPLPFRLLHGTVLGEVFEVALAVREVERQSAFEVLADQPVEEELGDVAFALEDLL